MLSYGFPNAFNAFCGPKSKTIVFFFNNISFYSYKFPSSLLRSFIYECLTTWLKTIIFTRRLYAHIPVMLRDKTVRKNRVILRTSAKTQSLRQKQLKLSSIRTSHLIFLQLQSEMIYCSYLA